MNPIGLPLERKPDITITETEAVVLEPDTDEAVRAAQVRRLDAATALDVERTRNYQSSTLSVDQITAHRDALYAAELKEANANAKVAAEGLKQTKLITGKMKIELAEAEREEAHVRAQDHMNFTYMFNEEISSRPPHEVRVIEGVVVSTTPPVRACEMQLTLWSRQKPNCDMEIIFDSPGGEVEAGFHLYDHIQLLRKKGHNITTTGLGRVASMAVVLLQAGNVRRIGAHAVMMIHEPSSGVWGSRSEQKDAQEYLEQLYDSIFEVLAERSIKTSDELKAMADRRNWWLTAAEALALGLVDEIIG